MDTRVHTDRVGTASREATSTTTSGGKWRHAATRPDTKRTTAGGAIRRLFTAPRVQRRQQQRQQRKAAHSAHCIIQLLHRTHRLNITTFTRPSKYGSWPSVCPARAHNSRTKMHGKAKIGANSVWIVKKITRGLKISGGASGWGLETPPGWGSGGITPGKFLKFETQFGAIWNFFCHKLTACTLGGLEKRAIHT